MEDKMIEKLAKFSKIGLSREEIADMEDEINSILEWAEKLEEIGEEWSFEYDEKKSFIREDEIVECESESILNNFPERENRFLKVPRNL